MNNSELASIDASLQTLVRQAYDLGRRDALKKVVDVLNTERPCAEPLALMAPEGGAQTPSPTPPPPDMPEPVETPPQLALEESDKPWWARR